MKTRTKIAIGVDAFVSTVGPWVLGEAWHRPGLPGAAEAFVGLVLVLIGTGFAWRRHRALRALRGEP